jgi:uncharacterized membrane protein YfhO
MLNTKYLIVEDKNGIFPYTNTDANGNAWFVSKLKVLESANEQIIALDSLDNKAVAVIEKSLASQNSLKLEYQVDSLASITLREFKPNYLKYESTNSKDGLAVFSEIYYENGWNAYIDGNLVPHLRVNYLLRALETPKGNHTIEFKFEPEVVETGSKVALASSVIFGILLLLGMFYTFKKKD